MVPRFPTKGGPPSPHWLAVVFLEVFFFPPGLMSTHHSCTRCHPWFSNQDWEAVERLETEPEFIPKTKDDQDGPIFDTPHWGNDFPVEEPNDRLFEGFTYTPADVQQFEGFTYTAKGT